MSSSKCNRWCKTICLFVVTLVSLFSVSSCDMIDEVRQSTFVIQKNRAELEKTTQTIRANERVIKDSNTAISSNKQVIIDSSKSIEENQHLISNSNKSIRENAILLERVNQAIKENINVVEGSTAILKRNSETLSSTFDSVDKFKSGSFNGISFLILIFIMWFILAPLFVIVLLLKILHGIRALVITNNNR